MKKFIILAVVILLICLYLYNLHTQSIKENQNTPFIENFDNKDELKNLLNNIKRSDPKHSEYLSLDNDNDNNKQISDLSIEKTPNSEALENVMKSLENIKNLKNNISNITTEEENNTDDIKIRQKPKPKLNTQTSSFSVNNDSCKFIGSNKKGMCPAEYPVFTGANFGIDGNGVQCGNTPSSIKKSYATAKLSKGKIDQIVIIKKGKGYSKPPKIKIVSKESPRENATAYCLVNKNGSLKKINVINPGEGYLSTPDILIIPQSDSECNLCCK